MISGLSSMLADAILVALVGYLVALQAWTVHGQNRREKLWATERARLLDAALARNAGDFRVRQTTAATDFDGPEPALIARPNRREPRPVPIGLDGGAM